MKSFSRAKAQRRKALPRFEWFFVAPLRLCARNVFLLEAESRSETPLTRLVRSIKPSDKSEVTAVGVTGGVREVRVVRRVQRLGSELELHLFRDRERPEDTQVRLEES